ncbi:MAG: glutamate--tRNA ligase [Candidatus Peribacteraceae bacterium]
MRTRFAPSPTGSLHVGGLRTALFSYLLAKKHGGTFILRIEDTDQAREVQGASEHFVRMLTWAGMPPDEGVMLDEAGTLIEKGEHGPYFQSARLTKYHAAVETLLKNGHAYHCFCTAERLDAMRQRQQAEKRAPMYDRLCTHLPKDEVQKKIEAGEKYVIRLKVPDENIVFSDEIYGKLSFKAHTIDDQVLLKSDGFPTYHLAHVVDDHDMRIDCVIRGEEWLPSLPKHLILWKCFGWDVPKYAHVPLILNSDRSKLSKRQGDVSVEAYVEKGYLPETLVNFLALLGWNPGTEQEVFSLPDLVNAFSLDRVQKSGAIFDLQKLSWLQGQWMRKIPLDAFVARIRPSVEEHYPESKDDPNFIKKAALIQERVTFFAEAPEMLLYFYREPSVDMEIVASKKQKIEKSDVPKIVEFLKKTLEQIPDNAWSTEAVQAALEAQIPDSGFKKGQILWPLRAILTGREYSPGAYEVTGLLGKEISLKRLKANR